MLRFAEFKLDLERAELRATGGEAIKLRPKTFALLHLFAMNANRLLTKQELMSAIWPNVHVGDDSLFQCIREIRAALGDNDRQRVKSVSGRGYLFEAQVTFDDATHLAPPSPTAEPLASPAPVPLSSAQSRWFNGWRHPILLASIALCSALGVAAAAIIAPRLSTPEMRTFVIVPIEARTPDPATEAMAASVTDRLTDGLSKVGNIRVLVPERGATNASAATKSDFVVRAELQRNAGKWEVQARLIETSTGQVQWSDRYSVSSEGIGEPLQQSRLAAGIGNLLALRINTLTHVSVTSPESKIIVEQAAAFINQTNRERFAAAQEMLEKAHAEKPNNVDIAAALSAHLMRGVAMVWYPPSENDAIEQRAKVLLDKAVKNEPNYIPVLQGYCRLLQTINEFAEALVACENALRFDPWDGLVMFQIGMAQVRLGRFEDGLATFERADTIDTPQVSRWTWPLGAGFGLILLKRYEEALPWLQRSLAITQGSGRTHLLIATALQALGRKEEAHDYVAKALQLRPGTTGENIGLPPKNESPRYKAEVKAITDLMVAAGVPAR